MRIEPYVRYQAEEILGLYAAVGWTNYTEHPDMLEKAYANSLLILGAYEGEKLVGILRAVGDGVSAVLIQDILVDPAYQRQGIGSALVKEALRRFSPVYQIQLVTDDTAKTTAFYRSLGFSSLEDLGCRGFMKFHI